MREIEINEEISKENDEVQEVTKSKLRQLRHIDIFN